MSESPLPGSIVESQHGGVEHVGHVLDETHPLDGWVWVDWEHIGRHDEAVTDITVIGTPTNPGKETTT